MTSTDPLSTDRLDRVRAYVTGLVEQGELPHAQLVIERAGVVAFDLCLGAARADDRPLQDDAIYRIASMTKAVTAVATMMLVEEGRLALADPVARYLPELADLAVYAGGDSPPYATVAAVRQPTVLDLLRHTAGFSYALQARSPLDGAYWEAGLYNFKAPPAREAMLASLAALPLAGQPGESFLYSVGTDVLGLVIERIEDRPLGDVLRTRILAPLGMDDTGFVVPGSAQHRLTDAWADSVKHGRFIYDAAEDSLWSAPPPIEAGGAGLASTATDYLRFCRLFLGSGAVEGPRLLAPATIAEMVRNQLPGGSDLSMGQGLFTGPGFRRMGHGLASAVTLPGGSGAPPPGELHWGGVFSTWFSIIPSHDISIVFMTQLIPGEERTDMRTVHRMLFGPPVD